MRFAIQRTSMWDGQPCEEARKGTYTRIETRTVDDPAKIPAHKGQSTQWWYESGENHRVVDGWITRDFPGEEAWFIEVNTLDELMALHEKHGDLIIRRLYNNYEIPCIEIYDGYRE